MKAKYIHEAFKKDQKPVGMSSDEGIDAFLKKMGEKGIKIGWRLEKEENDRAFIGKYAPYIEKYLNKLHEAGVPWENITLWGDHADVKSWQILKGNWGLFHCITEEDAHRLVKIIDNMIPTNSNFVISEDREHINFSDRIHMESDPEHRKWMEDYAKRKGEKRKTDLDFLDHIQETRKKIDSMK